MAMQIIYFIVVLASIGANEIRGHPQEDLAKESAFNPYMLAREKRAAEKLPAGWGFQMCYEAKNTEKCVNSPQFLLGIYFLNFENEEEINLCDDARVDAIFVKNDGTTYVFRGAYFWKVVDDKLVPDYPKLICDHWIGLPDDLDAAFNNKNDEIYFFKGSKYWKFNDTKSIEGYPKHIKDDFPGIPNNIQAASVYTYEDNEEIFFFKGKEYWKYEPNREPRVKKTYPKLISDGWVGIPDDLDEAVSSQGDIYFFKGIRHWIFDDEVGFIEGKYEPNPEAEEEVNLCENATVDAMFILYSDAERTEYVFKGAYYWKVVKDKLVTPEYPRMICDTWLGLPDNLDAAFTYKNNQIVFFKGSKYWQFTGTKRDKGYPKLIKDGFPGIPDNIQAATIWGKTNYVYFFKGNQYWRYEPGRKPPVRKGYPKLIKDVWEGVPDDLDEALLYSDGVTYFLKGIRYWTFNDEKLRVESAIPQLNGPEWFGCSSSP